MFGVSLKTTSLHKHHLNLNARMVPFAGYEMPISYDQFSGGIKKEHLLVRQELGIFDVSHMGEFWVEGPGSCDFLNRITTRSVDKTADGKAQYCLLLNEAGGILDDIIVYRFGAEKFWVVVNAANLDKDWAHFQACSKEFNVQLRNVSDETSLIAVQGPTAEEICSKIESSLKGLKYYSFTQTSESWIFARTGYTGEDGFEIFCPNEHAPKLWEQLLEVGAKPIGLGARDSLRMEVGFPLYGQELTEELKAHETFSSFAVRNDTDFIGKASLSEPARFKPFGIIGQNPKPLRTGEKLYINDELVGRITSGSYSPIRNKGMGLALLEASKLENRALDGLTFMLESAGKRREVNGESTPFVETRRAKKRKA